MIQLQQQRFNIHCHDCWRHITDFYFALITTKHLETHLSLTLRENQARDIELKQL
jgi:hypothetical protein